tara:strand:- start:380 stop:637 length:258 start_codon:yes stop_codon:yes gene_type:complete
MSTIKHYEDENAKIELSKTEFNDLLATVNNLNTAIQNAQEANDLWLSDVRNLEQLKWKMTELLGLTWDAETWCYKPTTKVRKNET